MRRLFSSLVAGAMVTFSAAATAQTRGWALDRFEPAPAGDSFFSSGHPRVPARSAGVMHAGLSLDYALRPLVFSRSDGAANPSFSVVDHFVALRAQASAEVARRVGFDVDLPFVATIGGSDANVSRVIAGGVLSGFTLGDPRLGVRLRIAGEADRNPLSVYLGAQGFFGFLQAAQRQQFATDESFRGRVYLSLAGRIGPLRWSVTTGYHGRPKVDLVTAFDPSATEGPVIASELFASAGLAWTLLSDRLSVGLEAWAQTPVERMFQRFNLGAEVIASGRYKPVSWLELALGLGPGLSRAVGTPAFRALFSATFTLFDGAGVPQRSAAEEDRLASLSSNERVATGETTVQATVARGAAPDHEAPCPFSERCTLAELDQDRDGVFSPIDQCPSQPAGDTPDPTRAGCPDPDGDGDGVSDHRDACPAEAAGDRPDPLRAGCPLIDRDQDNVADAVDRCPDQPGAPSADPERNGCPSLVRLEAGALRILEPVFFDTNRATIQRRSFAVLQAVVDAMRARRDIRRLSVEGHTDDRGDIERNVDLSVRRATAVMLWLVSQGVEPERVEAHGYGPTRPLTTERTAAARARNRRVEFRVVDPAPPSSSGATP